MRPGVEVRPRACKKTKNLGLFIALTATEGGSEGFLTGRSCSNYQSMLDRQAWILYIYGLKEKKKTLHKELIYSEF